MKKFLFVMIAVFLLVVSGCAIETYSEEESVDVCDSTGVFEDQVESVTQEVITATESVDFELYYELLSTSGEDRNWIHAATGCIFTEPEEIDLSFLFYLGTGDGGWEIISDRSRDDLVAEGFITEMDLQVMPREKLDRIVRTTFGVSLSDIAIPEYWYYISAEDAYCSNNNDAYFPGPITITSVTEFSDGHVDIHYTTDSIYDSKTGDFHESPAMILRLKKASDENWLVVSNSVA